MVKVDACCELEESPETFPAEPEIVPEPAVEEPAADPTPEEPVAEEPEEEQAIDERIREAEIAHRDASMQVMLLEEQLKGAREVFKERRQHLYDLMNEGESPDEDEAEAEESAPPAADPMSASDPDAWKKLPIATLAQYGLSEAICETLEEGGATTLGEYEADRKYPFVGPGKKGKIADAFLEFWKVWPPEPPGTGPQPEPAAERVGEQVPMDDTTRALTNRAGKLATRGEKSLDPHTSDVIWQGGYDAALAGQSISVCPHEPEPESDWGKDSRDDWLRGWLSGKQAAANGVTPIEDDAQFEDDNLAEEEPENRADGED